MSAQSNFSDYIVFVDESGDHSLDSVNQDYPLFCLSFCIFEKQELKNQYSNPAHPYHLAMGFGLERAYRFLKGRGQDEHLTHVICEARGKNEDAALELEFRRVCDGDNYLGKQLPFEIIIADKKTNAEGLQLADMTARPIGLSVLRPDQLNRAAEVLDKKFYQEGAGKKDGVGLKVFPKKHKAPR